MTRREPYTLRQLRWLHDQYQKANKKYWNSTLPADVRIIVVPAGRSGYSIDCRFKPIFEEAMTSTLVDTHTGEHLILPTIELNEYIMSYLPFARGVLYHEMIHVSGIDGHGKAFKTELTRLAKLGMLTDLLI